MTDDYTIAFAGRQVTGGWAWIIMLLCLLFLFSLGALLGWYARGWLFKDGCRKILMITIGLFLLLIVMWMLISKPTVKPTPLTN